MLGLEAGDGKGDRSWYPLIYILGLVSSLIITVSSVFPISLLGMNNFSNIVLVYSESILALAVCC